MGTWFRWGNLKEREHLEELGLDGRIILKQILKEWDNRWWYGILKVRIRLIWELL